MLTRRQVAALKLGTQSFVQLPVALSTLIEGLIFDDRKGRHETLVGLRFRMRIHDNKVTGKHPGEGALEMPLVNTVVQR